MTAPLAGVRIGLLTASASRAGGGVFEAVVQQAAMIRELGGEPIVFALRDAFSDADAGRFGTAKVSHSRVIGPAQIGYAPGLLPDLLASRLDLLHLHGIWMYPSRAATRWARLTGKPYVISPHGMLDPAALQRRAWKKSIGRMLYEAASWRAATAFHGLTPVEARNIEVATARSGALVIPNTIPAPKKGSPGFGEPLVLYLGRIHPIKNLAALIEGWRMATKSSAARLVIAGWGEASDISDLRDRIASSDAAISFLGPVFGDAKSDLIAQARFLILPSLSEAMPMTILEGWAAGVPAILNSRCNLPEGLAAGAAIDCGTSEQTITAALERALAQDASDWLAMSRAASALASGPFSAETIAARWASVYSGLVAAGS